LPLLAVGFRVVGDPGELLQLRRKFRRAPDELRVLAGEANDAGAGVAEPPQAFGPDAGLLEVILRRGQGAIEAGLELAAVFLETFEGSKPLGDTVLGATKSLPNLAPAVEPRRDLAQLLGGGLCGGGELLGVLGLAGGEATEGGGLASQGVGDLGLLPVIEASVAGGAVVLGPAVYGLAGLVHVLCLALAGRSPAPMGGGELLELLLLLAQLALPLPQILAAGDLLQLPDQSPRLRERLLVPCPCLAQLLLGQPVRLVIGREIAQLFVALLSDRDVEPAPPDRLVHVGLVDDGRQAEGTAD